MSSLRNLMDRPRLMRTVKRPCYVGEESVCIVQDEHGHIGHSYHSPKGNAICGTGPSDDDLRADDWIVVRTEMYMGRGKAWVVVPDSAWGLTADTLTKEETVKDRRARELASAGFVAV